MNIYGLFMLLKLSLKIPMMYLMELLWKGLDYGLFWYWWKLSFGNIIECFKCCETVLCYKFGNWFPHLLMLSWIIVFLEKYTYESEKNRYLERPYDDMIWNIQSYGNEMAWILSWYLRVESLPFYSRWIFG